MIVKIVKAPADPICSRVSIGGSDDLGVYCVYRGDLDRAIKVVREALNKLVSDQRCGITHDINRDYKELGGS